MKEIKKLLIITILLSVGFIMVFSSPSQATLPLVDETDKQWEVLHNDTLIYEIVDNVGGARYEAYNVTGDPWSYSASTLIDALNLTLLEYNETEDAIVNSDVLFQCAVDTDSIGFWQLSFYENMTTTGGFTFAFPLVPVDSSGLIDQAQLTTLGWAMNQNIGGTTYANALHLYESIAVSDTELHVYNSTNGHYVNLTYNAQGILEFAEIKIELDMGGPVTILQNITRLTGVDLKQLLNTIDETDVDVIVGDSLIYEYYVDGVSVMMYESYNVTYVGEIMGDYQGSDKLYWGANASKYDYNLSLGQWEFDPAWPVQTIGGGDDNYVFLRMDGPSNLVHPIGTNGSILEWNLASAYSSWAGLDIVTSGTWWVQFANATGQFIRIELEPDTGILYNLTYSFESQVISQVLIDDADLPGIVDLIPDTSFVANSTFINTGDWVQFNATGGPGDVPTDILWDFNDGTTDDMNLEPLHQFIIPGEYNVTFWAQDSDGDEDLNWMIITVTVDITPLSMFYSNVSSIDEWEYVGFTFMGGYGNEPSVLQWNFGDGSTNSTLENPVHQYTSNGIYTVVLTVIDNDGDSDISSQLITVNDVPPNAFFTANTTTIDEGESVSFTHMSDLGNEPTTFQWNFGDGTINSTVRNPVHQYTTDGTYEVFLTIRDNDGDVDMFTEYITVNDVQPISSFTTDGSIIDEGQTVGFTFTGDLGNGPSTLEWNFGDSLINSTLTNPTFQYTTPGVYTVVLTVRDGDGDISVYSDTIDVNDLPVSMFTANATTINEGDTIHFTWEGDYADLPSSLQWNFGDGPTNSTLENPDHLYTSAGVYSVILTVQDNDGDTDVYSMDITVQDVIPVSMFTANFTTIEEGQSVLFTFTGDLGNAPSVLQWNFNDTSSNSTETNPEHMFDAAGIYVVVLTVIDDDGDVDFYSLQITVNTPPDLIPTADFTADLLTINEGDTVQFTYIGNKGDLPTTFEWDFGDGTDTVSDENPSHVFENAGTYTVSLKVTDADGDVDEFTVIITVESTGVPGFSMVYLIPITLMGIIMCVIFQKRKL